MVRSGHLLKILLGIFVAFVVVISSRSTGLQAAVDESCRISVLGDSLTASYGIPVEQGFPAQLEQALIDEGRPCEVLDAGVSGDTTAGGLARLDWMLADRPTHVIIELGANDGLRGLPTNQMEANLDAIIKRLKAEGLPVFLTGMLPPPNLGKDYTEAFAQVFTDLAQQHEIPLYPFFLDGVAGEPSLNQSDQLHPLPEGVAVVVERIRPMIVDWLDDQS